MKPEDITEDDIYKEAVNQFEDDGYLAFMAGAKWVLDKLKEVDWAEVEDDCYAEFMRDEAKEEAEKKQDD